MNATLQMEDVNNCAQTSWMVSSAAVTMATCEMDQIAPVRVIFLTH